MYSQLEKQIAYALDPQAWNSYSGYSRQYKSDMDHRRNKTLAKAQEIVHRSEAAEMGFVGFVVIPDNTLKVMDALKKAETAISKRNDWVTNRKHQMEKLGELSEKLVEQYNRNPHASVKIDSLIRQIDKVSVSGAYDRFN